MDFRAGGTDGSRKGAKAKKGKLTGMVSVAVWRHCVRILAIRRGKESEYTESINGAREILMFSGGGLDGRTALSQRARE